MYHAKLLSCHRLLHEVHIGVAAGGRVPDSHIGVTGAEIDVVAVLLQSAPLAFVSEGGHELIVHSLLLLIKQCAVPLSDPPQRVKEPFFAAFGRNKVSDLVLIGSDHQIELRPLLVSPHPVHVHSVLGQRDAVEEREVGKSEKAVLVNDTCFQIGVYKLFGGKLHQFVHGLAARCGQEVLRDVDTVLHRVAVGDICALSDDSLEEPLASVNEREVRDAG